MIDRQAINRKAAEEIEQARREAGWVYADRLKLEGVLPLGPGDRFRVRGQRGWFRFTRVVTTPAGDTWVDAFGPNGQFRSITPERITRRERSRS